MYVYGRIEKVEQLDDGTMRVHGIASSESIDDQGEIVRASAMRDAIPEYLKFPALRSMHQLDAAGTTLTAEVGDDDITRVVAHVVDPIAVLKVKNNVFRAFSIGGRVTKRDPTNSNIITGIIWSELSLVDRPANPDAILSVWKSSNIEGIDDMNPGLATLGDTPAGETLAAAAASADPGAEAAKTAAAALAAPVQIWACGDNGHTHLVKTEALKCIEKRAAAGENGGTQWEPKPGSDGPASATKPAENITENITETAAVAETAEKLASVAETLEQPLVVIEPPLISEKGEAAAGPPDAAGEAEADAGTEEVAEADPPAEKAAQEASDVAQALGKAIDLVERARTALSTEGNYINWLTFTDNAKSVVEDVMRIRHHPLVPNDIPVYGYIYDVKSGKLQPSVRMKLPRL